MGRLLIERTIGTGLQDLPDRAGSSPGRSGETGAATIFHQQGHIKLQW